MPQYNLNRGINKSWEFNGLIGGNVYYLVAGIGFVFVSFVTMYFQIHFMVVALLFLIFDLEILLLFPLAVSLYNVSIFGFTIGIIFFIVLTIGFILEIGSGAISLVNLDQSTHARKK